MLALAKCICSLATPLTPLDDVGMPNSSKPKPRTRSLRPDFRLSLKCNNPDMPMVKSMLFNTSPSRKLRSKHFMCIDKEKGKVVTVCKQCGPAGKMQILGQGKCLKFDEAI